MRSCAFIRPLCSRDLFLCRLQGCRRRGRRPGAAAAHACCRSGHLLSHDHNPFLAGLALSFFLPHRPPLSLSLIRGHACHVARPLPDAAPLQECFGMNTVLLRQQLTLCYNNTTITTKPKILPCFSHIMQLQPRLCCQNLCYVFPSACEHKTCNRRCCLHCHALLLERKRPAACSCD